VKLLEAFRRALAPFQVARGRRALSAGAEELTIEWEQRGRSGVARLRWADVERAVAFKRDLYAVDLVCLAFEAGGEIFEIDEEMEGWRDVLAALPARLPGCLDGQRILEAVVQPPFAPSQTVVYERGGAPA
jgi:hypothetical protein